MSLTPNQVQARASNQYPVDFIDIVVSTTNTIRLCTFHSNLVVGTNTYLGNGNYLSFTGTVDDINIRNNPLNITLSSINKTFLATFLANSIEGSKVTVYRGFIGTNGRLVADPEERWGGFIFSSNVQDDYRYTNNDTIAITINCRSLLETILDSENGRFTNPDSFQRLNTSDQSMEFVAEMNTTEFPFGRDDG